MGEYADMAIDDALNGGHWGDVDWSRTRWTGRPKRYSHKARVLWASAAPSPPSDFADLFTK
jgi:hypothetical protein